LNLSSFSCILMHYHNCYWFLAYIMCLSCYVIVVFAVQLLLRLVFWGFLLYLFQMYWSLVVDLEEFNRSKTFHLLIPKTFHLLIRMTYDGSEVLIKTHCLEAGYQQALHIGALELTWAGMYVLWDAWPLLG